MTMEPKDELQLIEAVGKWANENFADKRGPDLGICEEVGEIFHCLLKARQGIRGFSNPAFFREQLTDALADTIIYLADYCYLHSAFFKFKRNQRALDTLQPDDQRKVLCQLMQAASTLLIMPEVYPGQKVEVGEQQVYNSVAQRVCTSIEMLATLHDIDLRLAVAATWAKVSKRNWVANPETAGNA